MKEMRKPIKTPANFQNWMCVYWEEKGGYDNAANFYDLLGQCSKSYGIKVNEPMWLEIGRN